MAGKMVRLSTIEPPLDNIMRIATSFLKEHPGFRDILYHADIIYAEIRRTREERQRRDPYNKNGGA